jgi:hypothetical protein
MRESSFVDGAIRLGAKLVVVEIMGAQVNPAFSALDDPGFLSAPGCISFGSYLTSMDA